jgi:hypothetical protein
MSFSDEMAALAEDINRENNTLLDRVSDTMLESIVNGSELTGAPGQPIAEGDVPNAGKLWGSWRKTAPSDTTRELSTDVDYAIEVEDNPRNLQFSRGGAHSVKLTLAGFDRIVEHETAAQRGG